VLGKSHIKFPVKVSLGTPASAPEIYQHAIQQALHGCEGIRNISDDIILHAKDDQQHDERLEKLLERLQQQSGISQYIRTAMTS